MLRQNPVKNLRRKAAYPGPGFRFYLPQSVWKETLVAIQRYAAYDSEGLVFWGGGVGTTGEGYITTVYIPNHPPQGYRARPDQTTMRQLVRLLHAADQKLLAQVHSHPGEAYHSFGDDENAASYHPGYLSIVIPDFGSHVTILSQCAVHEYDGREFVRLPESEVISRFVFEEQVVEIAPWGWIEEETLWKKLKQKLSSTGPKKL